MSTQVLSAQNKYHDVMLNPTSPKLGLLKRKRGRYYPTGTRQLQDGRVEVTFYLPPSILRQWQSAITDGKRIRLFVPR